MSDCDQHQIYSYDLVLRLWSCALEEPILNSLALLNVDLHNYLIHAIEKNSRLAHAASLSGEKLGFHVLKMVGDLSSFLR